MMRVLAPCLLIVLLVASGCGSSDGTDGTTTRDDGRDAPAASDADDVSPPDDDAGSRQVGEMRGAISIDEPKAFETLVGSFVLAGRARVAEGNLRWTIQGARGRVLARGSITASCGAPCLGTYRVPVPLARVPEGSWELRVFAPGSADGGPARLHETMVPITVAARRIEGAPPVDAPPPGGEPQG